MASLRIENLHKAFGAVPVLRGIDLDIADGEFVCFLGPSGCGKSTLLRTVAGLEDATDGTVLMDGADITALPSAKRNIAMVFQNYALYPHMNVRKNLSFGLSLNGMKAPEIAQRVDKAARTLQIGELLERKPRQLSGGQRQRVAIGRAIVREPKLFLLDEPLSNLDAGLRVSMRVELASLHRRLGTTMIYVTHDQVEAMTLSDRVVVLDQGKVAQYGSPLELFYRPANLFVAGFIGSPRMNFLKVHVSNVTGHVATVTGTDFNGPLEIALAETLAFGPSGPLTLGIRPDKLELGEPGSGHLQASIKLVERLGTESQVHAVLESGEDITAIVRGTHPVLNGDRVSLRIPSEHCHLFDAAGQAVQGRLDDETQHLINRARSTRRNGN